MPLYDLRCSSCGERWEDLLRRDEAPLCPACGKRGERLLPCRVHTRFRGKGFYSTDYKKK